LFIYKKKKNPNFNTIIPKKANNTKSETNDEGQISEKRLSLKIEDVFWNIQNKIVIFASN